MASFSRKRSHLLCGPVVGTHNKTMIVHVQNDVLALCGGREEGGGGWRGGERGQEGMGEEEGKEGGREKERGLGGGGGGGGGESRREEVGSEVKVHQT